MSESLDVWWPHFVQAVQQRRNSSPRFSSAKRAKVDRLDGGSISTAIVLSCAPSLLPAHTRRPTTQRQDQRQAPSWWSSQDPQDRTRRNQERLSLLRSASHEYVCFESRANDSASKLMASLKMGGNARQSTNPIMAAIASQVAGRVHDSDTLRVNKVPYRAIPVLPKARDTEAENRFSRQQRGVLSHALLSRAITEHGGRYPGLLNDTSGTQGDQSRSPLTGLSWSLAEMLASRAIGEASLAAIADRRSSTGPTEVTWADITAAHANIASEKKSSEERLDQHIKQSHHDDLPNLDPLVDSVRHAPTLSPYEKRLLPCIVDAARLSSTKFSDVHLPDKTLDAVRTLVSLPLIHPRAFAKGILKDHMTGGALLFGPPGTGKTLLARAVARESGARMLAIQVRIPKRRP